ncbi:MAG: ElyC/SanA/YdcF family protein, partial [Desulfobaccales bacterium]
TLVFLLLGWGFLRLMFYRGGKKGLGWIGLGLGCFYLFATAPLPNFLLKHLESHYRPLASGAELPAASYIVILSGGLRPNESAPATSQLDESSSLRMVEGIRLFHAMSGSPTLIMTGSGLWGDFGDRMKAFAQSLGVPAEKLIPENQARDTYGNAFQVRSLVKKEPFLLVTSAAHMPRAMRIFQNLGMNPVAAPGDFRFEQHYLIADYFPSGSHLTLMEMVIHEYLGLAYLYFFPARAGR